MIPNSDVLTTRGWVSISHIKPGDQVLSVDATGLGAEVTVTDVRTRLFEGDLVFKEAMTFTQDTRFLLPDGQLVSFDQRPTTHCEFRVGMKKWVGRPPSRAQIARFMGILVARRRLDCLPQWALGCSGRFIQWMLRAMTTEQQSKKGCMYAVNPVLRDQLTELALKTGAKVVVTAFGVDKGGHIKLSYPSIAKFGLHQRRVPVRDFVYGLVLPGPETFFVRQANKVWLSGGESPSA